MFSRIRILVAICIGHALMPTAYAMILFDLNDIYQNPRRYLREALQRKYKAEQMLKRATLEMKAGKQINGTMSLQERSLVWQQVQSAKRTLGQANQDIYFADLQEKLARKYFYERESDVQKMLCLAIACHVRFGKDSPAHVIADEGREHILITIFKFLLKRPQQTLAYCNACSTLAFVKCCSRCKQVFYCSQACQRDDWFRHKAYCKPPQR